MSSECSRIWSFDFNQEDALGHVNLSRGKSHALSVPHRLNHIVDESLERLGS
jgi:hypothetical protein